MSWCRIFVSMIRERMYSELGKCATNEAGNCLFRAANVWWKCEQYFVIASCG